MSEAYTKCVTYEFEVDGDTWALSELRMSGDGTPWCDLEETRKNGQEDTHMGATLSFEDGKWRWADEDDGDVPYTIKTYASRATADAILAYVNEHGHPEMKP